MDNISFYSILGASTQHTRAVNSEYIYVWLHVKPQRQPKNEIADESVQGPG